MTIKGLETKSYISSLVSFQSAVTNPETSQGLRLMKKYIRQ